MTNVLDLDSEPRSGTWTFLTNHSHVLLALYWDPDP